MTNMVSLLALHWSLLVGLVCGVDNTLVVNTNNGPVSGIKEFSATHKSVDVWYSIPFAQPPVGNLRFRHPKPIDSWTEVKNVTKLPNSCWQNIDSFFGDFAGSTMWNANTPMDEDCLYLSVIVPRPRKPNRSVMVWIYGGGFYSGTSTLDVYDYKTLAAEQDVILVAPQYRVANLGFLFMGSPDIPGNAGLYDQLMAMQWIRDNIEHFGGNKDSITIFGQNAGATSVAMHLLSPLSKGLFSQAIMQSSAATVPWGIVSKEEIILRGLKLAEYVDCPHRKNESEETIACLKKINPYDLVNNEPILNDGNTAFAPIIDGVFLDELPIKSLIKQYFKKTNILLGSNREEGFRLLVYLLPDQLRRRENVTISEYHYKRAVIELFPKYSDIEKDAIIHEYTNWMNPDSAAANMNAIDNIIGDNQFTCSVNDMAYYYALSGSNVYMYNFIHRSSQHKWPKWMGVLQGDEIAYIFGKPLNKKLGYAEEERKLSIRMMRFWANFAKTGNPGEDTEGKLATAYWPRYTANEKLYLTLNASELTVGKRPRLKQCAFWNQFMPNLHKYIEHLESVGPPLAKGKCSIDSSSCRISSVMSPVFLICLTIIIRTANPH